MAKAQLPAGSYWSEEDERYILPSEVNWSPRRYKEISAQDFGPCMCGGVADFIITTTVHSIEEEHESKQQFLTICQNCAKAAGVFAKKRFGNKVEAEAETEPAPAPEPEPITEAPEPEPITEVPEPEPEAVPSPAPEPAPAPEGVSSPVPEPAVEPIPEGFAKVKGSGEPLKKAEV